VTGKLMRIVQPLLGRMAFWEARRVMRRFHRNLGRMTPIQEQVLLEKVCRNAQSDFGRDHGFASIRSVDDFRRAVPVSTYDDYEPYIDKVRHGQGSAMFGPGQTVRMFAMTSGTTSRPKYIPVTDAFLKEYRRGWLTWGVGAYLDHPSALQSGILQLVSPANDEIAPCGIPCGAISGLSAQMQHKALHNVYVLPPEAVQIKDTQTKYYVALLLSLERRCLVIASANPSTLLGLAATMGSQADRLLRDVSDGTLGDDVDVSGDVRHAVNRKLKGDVTRRREIEQAASADGGLTPKAVWEMPFIGCWKGGTLGLYLQEFPRYYGHWPARDIGLVASEGRMTIPLSDEASAGVLDIQGHFFEFLPARDGQRAGDEPLLPHQVELGREYFILLTNSAGLYRYDIGDIVRVTGFHEGSPLLEFLSKGAHYSSLTGEKLAEHQVTVAMGRATDEANLRLTSYCLAPRWTGGVPHYVLLVEEQDLSDAPAARQLCSALDRLLREANIEYNAKRASGRLGPVCVKTVPRGTWRRFDLKTIAERRRGIEQYKHKFLVGDVAFEANFPAVAEFGPGASGDL
jgi:GH3 auxin-responsive promoter